MFMNSQVGLLSSGILAISAVAAGLRQESESGAGIIQSIDRVFGRLIRAAVSALSEKDGLVPLIATAFFAAGRSYYQHNASGRSMASALDQPAVLWVGDSQAKTSGGPFRIHFHSPMDFFWKVTRLWSSLVQVL
jgi:hypothetical protein